MEALQKYNALLTHMCRQALFVFLLMPCVTSQSIDLAERTDKFVLFRPHPRDINSYIVLVQNELIHHSSSSFNINSSCVLIVSKPHATQLEPFQIN